MNTLENICCVDVSAVLVTFNPCQEDLVATVRAVAGQVSNIYVVDNGSSNYSIDWVDLIGAQSAAKCHFLHQEENMGLGAAHNIGINQAIKHGSQFVLLLDQDSQVGSDMVVRLRSAYQALREKGISVAALGPRYRDAELGILSRFMGVGLGRFVRRDCEGDNGVIDTEFLVSSGALLPVAAIDSVGLMDEGLFIDHVDTEWCFRAKSKGLKIFGVCDAVMTHALGEKRIEVTWIFRQRIVTLHKPFRYYYMFRNSVLLYRRSYMPWKWKLADIIRILKVAAFLGWMAEDRLECLKMMWAGVVDGLKGVNGRRGGS